MPALTVDRLKKSYGTRMVFDGVSFAIEDGEKVGFIGVNGSGKSTLFRIVAGLEGHEDGSLAYRRGMSVGYLAQDPELDGAHTVLEAAAGGREALELAAAEHRQHELEAVLTRLGVDRWDRAVAGLSGGERKRVALARVLAQRPELLLLDEPTNHLDADTTEWLEGELSDYPGAVMLITHDRYFLDHVVTRMIEVNRAELVPFPGGFTEYLEARAEREARQAISEEKRSRLIAQELAWVKRAPSARTGKQKARIQRLQRAQREQQAERLPERDVVELRYGRPPRLGRTVLELEGLTKGYEGRPLIEGFSTRLRAGERIGIVGPNGAGKTTLLRLILGLEAPDAGQVRLGVNTRMAYYDQVRIGLDPDADLIEAVAGRQDWVEVGEQRVHVRSYLNSYLFASEVHEQKVGSLSGGEKNRLLLARLLLEDANLLILDEPTNDLDVFTLQVLEAALVDFAGCVLVVTHDRYFLDKIATALFVFEGEGRVRRHEGGYDAYRRWREATERQAAESTPVPKPRAPGGGRSCGGTAGPRRLSYREKQELQGMEDAITAAEAERERLEVALADPALYASAQQEVAGLSAAYDEARRRVEALYARWEELEAQRREGGSR
jgi:ABC transport system ATP-binding/permease protein